MSNETEQVIADLERAASCLYVVRAAIDLIRAQAEEIEALKALIPPSPLVPVADVPVRVLSLEQEDDRE